ncbi:MAG: hypothetical protein FWG72_09580 [Oscillospiraceae bacterium]|nr:hypothetical protein [Oscillospiraceae bacterium]
MEYVRQTVSSAELNDVFVNLPPSLRNTLVEVIILPAEKPLAEKPNFKCRLGFLKGPELPPSFFDPLPEEDLQAWGL